jgi:hypothetical protein
MKFLSLIVLMLALVGTKTFAQSETGLEKKKGSFYVTWGYHRDGYSRSTIHFKDHTTDDYNFTLYKAKAKDKVDTNDFFHTPLTVPQYVLNIGYLFNNKRNLGIEFSWDHLKYVMIDNQMMHLRGDIRGQHFDLDTLVSPDFVKFEHTNGNNYAMISLVKQLNVVSGNKNHSLNALFKVGVGGLVPKTDSYIMGGHNDGPFRLSGFVVGASANLRYNIFHYFFLETGMKGSFADYTNAKLVNEGRVRHHFFSIQFIGAAGISIPMAHW